MEVRGFVYPRANYEMTQADLDKILDACSPQPMIMLQIPGLNRSPQERANDAWAELGSRMGFDHMTVKPGTGGDRFFTAVPSETAEHKATRLADEAEQKRLAEIATLENEILTRQARLEELDASRASGRYYPGSERDASKYLNGVDED